MCYRDKLEIIGSTFEYKYVPDISVEGFWTTKDEEFIEFLFYPKLSPVGTFSLFEEVLIEKLLGSTVNGWKSNPLAHFKQRKAFKSPQLLPLPHQFLV